LCNFAIEAGFFNCEALRADPGNSAFLSHPLKDGDVVAIPDLRPRTENCSTDKVTKFVRKNTPPVSIRFVHGSPNKHYLADDESTFLNVSNHVTDKAGANDNAAFPDQFEFQQPGHDDPDTFKVEVVDSAAGGSVNVTIQALKRVFLPNGSFGHDVFPGAMADKRKLDPAECKKVRSGVAYRSKYLRLVTDGADRAAKPNQTLLVTDATDQGDPDLEILGQAVRATYQITRCPGNPKCAVRTKDVPVGSDTDKRKPRGRVRLAVHVLRLAPGGAPVVTTANAERRVTRWFRRIYAQAGFAPRIVSATREVDPVSNLIAVSNDRGVSAAGDGQLGFRLTAPGLAPLVVGPITPSAGDTPATTANALATLVQAPYSANVTVNPARFPDGVASRSADLLITPSNVTIDQVVSGDSRQTLTVGRPNPANLLSWDGNNFLVGSIEQRTILKNYDTGADRIDVFVVRTVTSGNLGEAMMSGHKIDPQRRAIDPVKFSAFVIQSTMDGSDKNPTTLPHECGHTLLELIHADGPGNATQLMTGQPIPDVATVNGTKRMKDGLEHFDRPPGNFKQLKRIRTEGAPVLDPF
jgi:hypothetical protein